MKKSVIREFNIKYGKKVTIAEKIVAPKQIAECMKKIIQSNGKEHLVVFCLDSASDVIGYNIVSIGTVDQATAHPREIFQPAIVSNATRIILAHNHPSNDVKPSRADIDVTDTIVELSKLFNIQLLDHVIVSNDTDEFYSLYENGKINYK
jgi:DNA repair protein RadC